MCGEPGRPRWVGTFRSNTWAELGVALWLGGWLQRVAVGRRMGAQLIEGAADFQPNRRQIAVRDAGDGRLRSGVRRGRTIGRSVPWSIGGGVIAFGVAWHDVRWWDSMVLGRSTMTARDRLTAAERREDVLRAAIRTFGVSGYAGTTRSLGWPVSHSRT